MNEDVNLNWTEHTQDMFQMERQVLFRARDTAQRNIIRYIRQIYLHGEFWAKMSGILISSLLPLAIKGKSADLELPHAAAL